MWIEGAILASGWASALRVKFGAVARKADALPLAGTKR